MLKTKAPFLVGKPCILEGTFFFVARGDTQFLWEAFNKGVGSPTFRAFSKAKRLGSSASGTPEGIPQSAPTGLGVSLLRPQRKSMGEDRIKEKKFAKQQCYNSS